MDIKDMLASIAYYRKCFTEAKERLGDAKAERDATPQGIAYNVIQEEVSRLGDEMVKREEQAREEIVKTYIETGNKKPAIGTGIRVSKGKLLIKNPVAAVEWAKKNMPIAVVESVDDKAVLAWAEQQAELPEWIERLEDKVTATIATDLSAYIIEELPF